VRAGVPQPDSCSFRCLSGNTRAWFEKPGGVLPPHFSTFAFCSPSCYSGHMSDYSDSTIIEAYEIERTVEVLLASKHTFRLEIMRTEKGANVEPYHVMAYERQTLYRAPDGTITSDSMIPKTVPFHVWVRDLGLPTYTYNRDTPEAALSNALSLLVEQRNNPNTPW